ncbi:MAG: PAS domain S-box protein [Thermoplasmata archaeon]|nr:MAG: PAS domain S-box protein [Thermoplasmata archaeon]
MEWQSFIYIIPMLIAGTIPVILTLYTAKNWNSPLIKTFIFIMAALSIWSFGYALELWSTSLSTSLLLVKIEYIGIVMLPVVWLAFALQYTGKEKWITPHKILLLLIIPIFALITCWTNYNHLFYKSVKLATGPVAPVDPSYGPAFWILVIYSHILTLIGVLLFLRKAIDLGRLYLKQGVMLAIGVIAPLIGNAVYVTGLSPFPAGYDLTPLLFDVTGIVLVCLIFRFRFLDIIPIARNIIFENVSDAIFVLDNQNRIIDFNEAGKKFAENVSHLSSEIVGEHAEKIFHPDILKRCREGDKAKTNIEMEIKGNYYDIRISPIYDKRMQSLGHVIILRDISERKKAEEALKESEEKYRSLFEFHKGILKHSPAGILKLDENLRIIYENPEMKKMMGVPAGEESKAMGMDIRELPSIKEAGMVEMINDLLQGKELHGEIPFTSLYGKEIYLSFVVSPILEKGKFAGAVLMVIDITERKKNEEKIKQLNEALRLINKIMRHDILNDLQVVNSSLDLYRESKDEKLLDKAVERINQGVKLIHRMRELESLISSGKELKEYDIREVVEDIINDYSVDFNVKGNGIVLADEFIHSVIDNIVGNAVLHGKTDKIDIIIENKDDVCEIRIVDYGIGIPDKIKDKIFDERFSYGETRGSGLGLYIVKKAIERYGGSIHVEDNKPNGAVFVIKLKLKEDKMEDKNRK